MRLTSTGQKTVRVLGGLVVVLLIGLGLRYMAKNGFGKKILSSFVPDKVEGLDAATEKSQSNAAFAGLPSDKPAALPGAPEVRVNFWAWNSQMGCMLANGGPVTTEGSLMAKQGVKVFISRQDDNSQLMAQLTKLAAGMHAGQAQPRDGIHFIGIMGDGAGAFLSALNSQLTASFGPEYRAEVVGSCGYSRGEDKLMGPQKWRDNPQSMRGALVAGVLRDGDWNIAQRFMGDNNIPNNPDERTWDADAVNWVNTSSYTDAAEKYVSNYCEDRPVVAKGKRTGETKRVCVDGIVTWTPADVTAARERGGIVSVVSTKEYSSQMPHVLIGIHKWNQDNRATVEKVLQAFLEGGDQVLAHPQALTRAAEISQEIYQESGADAAYWERYYKGVTEPDKQGLQVELGGSKANNLADNLQLFGLASGTTPETSRMRATYTVFGKLVTQQYPDLVPSIPAYDSVFDVSYLRAISQRVSSSGATGGQAETTSYGSASTPVTRVVGRRNYQITFRTGSADVTPETEKQLQELFDVLSINSLAVEVHGHTDNVGDATANQQLSEDRAMAVKQWLERRSASTFPQGRLRVFAHGSTQPVESNRTETGRAANRRVEIVIGS
ncbi:OmpA family protein [Longimicrobium terrae]|uniref:Outer membrane protein OmpA-like peptidoglycan-associated protein n=1 Tax=Longimicrobium terrae TaxID=1639882 RepID=A0A841GY72_9BACT|nr:OmpA family protein [Longimicrobium terrae]MBB4636325.1 outer membrane protein OmpA-like peptidoglycan-associated protein [Longimicrobium terrae]MBB6070721.1 outer membrane protein OmpA-like peptidoglycan-associated protein [Longimicrobium terrae]NNC29701.1 OmpA family protein [Longimicrobium terrae]